MKLTLTTLISLLLFHVTLGECAAINETRIAPTTPYIAELVEVNFDKCSYQPTKKEFYRSIVSSFATGIGVQGCTVKNQLTAKMDYYPQAIAKSESSYNKPCDRGWIDGSDSKWSMLNLGPDLTTLDEKALVVTLGYYGGAGFIYLPFLHSEDTGLSNDHAYMIKVTPDYKLINNGVQFTKKIGGSKSEVYGFYNDWDWCGSSAGKKEAPFSYSRQVKLDLFTIYKEVGNTFTPNIRSAFTYLKEYKFGDCDGLYTDRETVLQHKVRAVPSDELCSYTKTPTVSIFDLIAKASDVWKVMAKVWKKV